MARTRLELHDKLCGVLESKNVYFRPPSKGMKYPCIIYTLDGDNANFANNAQYIKRNRWSITVIDEDPDSEIPGRLKESLPYCGFDRTYESDGLNHFVYTLYF